MHASRRTFVSIIALLALVALLWPSVALAHERRTIGAYQFVVGWIVEPAIEGEKNGVDLRITKDTKPVTGVEKTLKVEIMHVASGAKRSYDLRTIFNDPGHYTADLIPTVPGQYRMHFTGLVEDTKINESFDSGPGRYGDIEAVKTLFFPTQPADAAALQPQITAAQAAADNARSTGMMLGIAGIVLGIVGIGVGAAALMRSKKA